MSAETLGGISELGQRYLAGELRQQALTGEFWPSRREDVPRHGDFSDRQREHFLLEARQCLRGGEVAFAVLAAGASSRMDLKNIPQAVRTMLAESGRRELPISKALVPVLHGGGHTLNYLDLFLLNVARFSEQTGARGPAVLFVSEANAAEIGNHLDSTDCCGLDPDLIIQFQQPLAPQIVATEQDVLKARKNFAEVSLAEVLEISQAHAGRDLPQRKPAGHGEFLHQLVASGTLAALIQQGIRFIAVRNIDNAVSLLDHAWLTALGYLLAENAQMLVEVSQRPRGQKGGALIRTPGGWQLAEDPSFAGTKHQASDSYYMNNAVAILSIDYFLPIYDTCVEELLEANRQTRTKRREHLAEIAHRGRTRFPMLLEAKPVILPDGRAAGAVTPETNMWESTGTVPGLRILPFAVDSERDAGEDLLQQPADEQRRRALHVRFAPTKNWADYENPTKQCIVQHVAQRLLQGDLTSEP